MGNSGSNVVIVKSYHHKDLPVSFSMTRGMHEFHGLWSNSHKKTNVIYTADMEIVEDEFYRTNKLVVKAYIPGVNIVKISANVNSITVTFRDLIDIYECNTYVLYVTPPCDIWAKTGTYNYVNGVLHINYDTLDSASESEYFSAQRLRQK